MIGLKIIFWISVFIVCYVYLLYPLLLLVFTRLKKEEVFPESDVLPTITLFVSAYNEECFVDQKVANSLELNYPSSKLKLVWVTDGSNDNTNVLLEKHPQVQVLFEPERKGKINAMNRGVQQVATDLIVFSDANTLLGENTLKEIVRLFQNPKVGCVAGEKRILISDKDSAASSGEGFYWRYESWIKQMDAQWGSTIGAAGELFAIKTKLFNPVEPDTILDDFIISLRVAMQGYKIAYSTEAYAYEKASANVAEEMKRKVRIAAGSIQSLGRLLPLLNLFKYKRLSFQYISHKVLRWVFVPIALVSALVVNVLLVDFSAKNIISLYPVLLCAQLVLYVLALFGYLLKNKNIRLRVLFVPYYFFVANYAMWLGFFRFLKGNQSVNWERAKRAE